MNDKSNLMYLLNKFKEASNSRISQYIEKESNWTIIINNSKNTEDIFNIKKDIKKQGLGYIEFIAKYIDANKKIFSQQGLFVIGLTESQSNKLSERYSSFSFIIYEDNSLHFINDVYDEHEQLLIELVELESPRPSYFQKGYTYKSVYKLIEIEELPGIDGNAYSASRYLYSSIFIPDGYDCTIVLPYRNKFLKEDINAFFKNLSCTYIINNSYKGKYKNYYSEDSLCISFSNISFNEILKLLATFIVNFSIEEVIMKEGVKQHLYLIKC